MTTQAQRSEQMNAAIDAADITAVAATRAAVDHLPLKACPRCAGKGEGYFLGTSNAPGVCFRCAGSGRVWATPAAAKVAKLAQATTELARLRTCWKAIKVALDGARAELAVVAAEGKKPNMWGLSEAAAEDADMVWEQAKAAERRLRAEVRELECALASYEAAGKAARATVDAGR